MVLILVSNIGAKYWCQILVSNIGVKYWCQLLVLIMVSNIGLVRRVRRADNEAHAFHEGGWHEGTSHGQHLPASASALPTPYQHPTSTLPAPCLHPVCTLSAPCQHPIRTLPPYQHPTSTLSACQHPTSTLSACQHLSSTLPAPSPAIICLFIRLCRCLAWCGMVELALAECQRTRLEWYHNHRHL